jgi:hypothetical protein
MADKELADAQPPAPTVSGSTDVATEGGDVGGGGDSGGGGATSGGGSDSGGSSGGGGAGGGGTATTVDYGGVLSGLYKDFGSNFLPFGVSPLKTGTLQNIAAGQTAFVGMTPRTALGGTVAGGGGAFGSTYTIVNNFQEPPSDPHTWTKGIEFETRALG